MGLAANAFSTYFGVFVSALQFGHVRFRGGFLAASP